MKDWKTQEENEKTEERNTMKIGEAKELSFEEFSRLDDAYGGFATEISKNHPLRDEGEEFMEFVKKGSEKIKTNPTVKKILG